MVGIPEEKKALMLFLRLGASAADDTLDKHDVLVGDTVLRTLDIGGGEIRVFWQRMGFSRFSGLPLILIRFICLHRSSSPLTNKSWLYPPAPGPSRIRTKPHMLSLNKKERSM
ncbi:MAG: hypothetical protein SGARI_002465 [Bacillariaceae sp.]